MAMVAIGAFIYNIFKTYNSIRIATRIHRFKTYLLFDSEFEFDYSEESPLNSSSDLESNRISIGFGGSGYDFRSEARTR